MGAATAPQGTGRMSGVGKKELCVALGWSRPKLDRRLLSDPAFPVLNRGDQSGGWQFDLVAVNAYLGGAPTAPTPAPPAIDQAQLRDALAPPAPQLAATVVASSGGVANSRTAPTRRSAHHEGEATARQRKDDAQAALLEIKLAVERGEVIPRTEVEAVTTELFTVVAGELDALPEDILKALELPPNDEMAERLRMRLDELRFTLHQKLTPLLDPAAPQG